MIKKIIFASVIIILIFFTFEITKAELGRKVIPAEFILGERAGFDLNPNKLTFGKIELNQSAERSIKIDNNFNKPITVSIKSSGEISKNLIVSENNFRLEPHESKNITFSIYTENLTEFKKYSGNVIIISNKV